MKEFNLKGGVKAFRHEPMFIPAVVTCPCCRGDGFFWGHCTLDHYDDPEHEMLPCKPERIPCHHCKGTGAIRRLADPVLFKAGRVRHSRPLKVDYVPEPLTITEAVQQITSLKRHITELAGVPYWEGITEDNADLIVKCRVLRVDHSRPDGFCIESCSRMLAPEHLSRFISIDEIALAVYHISKQLKLGGDQ
jgi:hypothetical protein